MRAAAADLATTGKHYKATIAALEAAGQHQQVVQFLNKQGEEMAKKGEEPANVLALVEQVMKSAQGPKLRSEMDAVLNAMLESASVRQRESIHRLIQENNSR